MVSKATIQLNVKIITPDHRIIHICHNVIFQLVSKTENPNASKSDAYGGSLLTMLAFGNARGERKRTAIIAFVLLTE